MPFFRFERSADVADRVAREQPFAAIEPIGGRGKPMPSLFKRARELLVVVEKANGVFYDAQRLAAAIGGGVKNTVNFTFGHKLRLKTARKRNGQTRAAAPRTPVQVIVPRAERASNVVFKKTVPVFVQRAKRGVDRQDAVLRNPVPGPVEQRRAVRADAGDGVTVL